MSEDKIILNLMKEIEKQKKAINKAESSVRLTNCSFSFTEGRKDDNINLNVCTDLKLLITIVAFLRQNEANYAAVVKDMAIEKAPEFKWQNFKVADWISDIGSRIDKLQITERKKKLEALESRAEKLISPELRRKLELEAIQAELAG